MHIMTRLGIEYDPKLTVTKGRGLWEHTKEFYPESTRGLIRERNGAVYELTSHMVWEDKAWAFGYREWYLDGRKTSVEYIHLMLDFGATYHVVQK